MKASAAWLVVLPALIHEPSAAQNREWTTADDHRHMMEQLGIRALRPGPSGNEQAPNHANYDETLANPFPNLPDALTLANSRRVTSAATWFAERRPQIVEDFEREVVGRVPKRVPSVTWRVAQTTKRSEERRVGKECRSRWSPY